MRGVCAEKIRLILSMWNMHRLIRCRNNLGQHPRAIIIITLLPDYIYRLLKPLLEKFWMLSFSPTRKKSH